MSIEASEKKLLAKLARLNDPKKEIKVLLELATLFYRTDGSKSLDYASSAHRKAEATNDSELVLSSLIRIADAHYFLGKYNDSLVVYESCLKIAETLPDSLVKSQLFTLISFPLTAQGDYGRLLDYLNQAVSIYGTLENYSGLSGALRMIGAAYYQLSDYKKAYAFSYKSLQLAQQIGDRRNEAQALDRIALIYNETSEKQKSLSTFNQVLAIFRELNDEYNESAVLGNMGTIYNDLGQNEIAIKCYHQCLNLQRKHGNVLHELYTHCNLANAYLDDADTSMALQHAEKAISMLEWLKGHLFAKATAYAHYARVLNFDVRPDQALAFALEALSIIGSGRSQYMMTFVLQEIIASYEKLGEHSTALEYQRKLSDHKLNVLRTQTDDDLRRMELRHELDRKEKEKESYRLRNMQLEEELRTNVERVTQLARELIDRNEFLASMKQKVQALYPSANGHERVLRHFAKEIEEKISSDNAHGRFDEALTHLHVGFTKELIVRFPELTAAERKVCSLIKLGLTSQQMADLLFTSVRTIEGHRLKIRKKMNIGAHADISAVIQQL